MLSGGLKRFGWEHPELLEGGLPDHLAKPKTPSPTGSRRGQRIGSGSRTPLPLLAVAAPSSPLHNSNRNPQQPSPFRIRCSFANIQLWLGHI